MNKPKFQARTLFLVAYIVFALLPIYWIFSSSLKTENDFLSIPPALIFQPTLGNYAQTLSDSARWHLANYVWSLQNTDQYMDGVGADSISASR